MKKIALIISFVTLISLSSSMMYSLGFSAGVKGGFSMTYFRLPFSPDTNLLLGLSGGGAVEFMLENPFAVEIDLMYQQRNGEFREGEEKIAYLGIPIMAKYYLMDTIYLGAGFNYQFKQNATFVGNNDSNIKSTNFELLLGGGMAFPFTPQLDFTADVRYYHGILNINSNASNSFYTRAFEFLFGIMFRI